MSSIWVSGLEDISPLMIGQWAHSPSFNWLKCSLYTTSNKNSKGLPCLTFYEVYEWSLTDSHQNNIFLQMIEKNLMVTSERFIFLRES